MEQDSRRQDSTLLPTSKPGRSSSARPMADRRRKGNYSQHNIVVETKADATKADAWEKNEMEKVDKRYEIIHFQGLRIKLNYQ